MTCLSLIIPPSSIDSDYPSIRQQMSQQGFASCLPSDGTIDSFLDIIQAAQELVVLPFSGQQVVDEVRLNHHTLLVPFR